MTKEGYQPIKTKKTTKIILPNTGSHVQMKKDGYTWEDLDRSYWEGFDNAKNKMEKRIEELEEKISILLSCKNCPENKGGLLCQKEYEDKCLSQKIQYIKELKEEIAELEKELEQAKKVQVVEHFEAYGQCRDSRRIASLEKENAELKDKLKNLESVAKVRLTNWQKYEEENKELKEQNYKTKVALRNVIDYLGQFCPDYPDCVIKAEQFLKECE